MDCGSLAISLSEGTDIQTLYTVNHASSRKRQFEHVYSCNNTKKMVFSSPVFLFFFLPLVLLIYVVVPRVGKNVLLLLASLLFYSWGEGVFVAILLLSIVLNYCTGILLKYLQRHVYRGLLLGFGVGANLSLLATYKYAGFFADNLNGVLQFLGTSPLHFEQHALPIGISFFTFQAISYLVDVYRGDAVVQTKIIDLALYISLFPQLIAGPIVRYQTIERQLSDRSSSLILFSSGISRFMIGLAKKTLIADVLGAASDAVFALPSTELSVGLAWFGVLCFSLQIYFDFSGYSDMAIGLGKMFGFNFPENFRYPYASRSLREFWRRWHISLSTWFRDYLYIPLGGSRMGELRTCFNLTLVFVLCGLWHGARWNFVFWGLAHGLVMVAERYGLERALRACSRPLQHAYLLTIVLLTWVLFRSESLAGAVGYYRAMFGLGESSGWQETLRMHLNQEIVLVLIVGLFASAPLAEFVRQRYAQAEQRLGVLPRTAYAAIGVLLLTGVFFYSCLSVAANTYQPFLYFRF